MSYGIEKGEIPAITVNLAKKRPQRSTLPKRGHAGLLLSLSQTGPRVPCAHSRHFDLFLTSCAPILDVLRPFLVPWTCLRQLAPIPSNPRLSQRPTAIRVHFEPASRPLPFLQVHWYIEGFGRKSSTLRPCGTHRCGNPAACMNACACKWTHANPCERRRALASVLRSRTL